MTPPLVLLHGASGNAATWAPLLHHWSWASPTVLDLPGRGASPGPALTTVPELARWLADRLPAGAPIVVGHSLGGGIALQLALDFPEQVGGIVLVSSSARLKVGPALLAAVAAATEPLPMDVAFGPHTNPSVVRAYNQTAASTPPSASLADWTACNAFDVRSELGRVEVPVLVIHGSEDTFTPARFQGPLADALPDATHIELSGPGHMLPWEAPEPLADHVRNWVAGR